MPKALRTTAYEHRLLLQLVNSTIADVCQKEDTSYDVVLGTIERWMATSIDWEVLPVPAKPVWQFLDPAYTNYPQRFYRLQWP